MMKDIKMFSPHNHTDYSNIRLLDSINKLEDMVEYAMEIGLKGLAITDHEVLSSHVQANKLQKKLIEEGKDFKIVLGNEIYLVDNVEETKYLYAEGHKPKFYHFLLLAKNAEGHKQLRELSSKAWSNLFKTGRMERVPLGKDEMSEIIGDNKGNLIASTACLGGELPQLYFALQQAIKDNDQEKAVLAEQKAKEFVQWGLEQFGRGNFFIEIQPSESKEQLGFNKFAVELANEVGVDFIVTTDSHYLDKKSRPIHKAYLNSKQGDREVDDFYATTYLMDVDEIVEHLTLSISKEDAIQSIENTMLMHDMCEFYDLHREIKVPKIELPDYDFSSVGRQIAAIEPDVGEFEYIHKFLYEGEEQDKYFLYEVLKGLLAKEKVSYEYLKRIDLELSEIWGISEEINERVSAYYVTAQKIIQIMWGAGDSIVGPARGSVTGYLTAYLTDITQVDPIQWNLPHWRHLTSTRPEMPKLDNWACKRK